MGNLQFVTVIEREREREREREQERECLHFADREISGAASGACVYLPAHSFRALGTACIPAQMAMSSSTEQDYINTLILKAGCRLPQCCPFQLINNVEQGEIARHLHRDERQTCLVNARINQMNRYCCVFSHATLACGWFLKTVHQEQECV